MCGVRHSLILHTIGSLLIVVSFTTSAIEAGYSGGAGNPDDPYRIATAADLIALGETPEDYDKHFILTADIDLDPNLPGRKVFDKAAIAPDWNAPFTGVFDGNGHTISNFRCISTSTGLIGLFGCVGGEVKDLTFVDTMIDAKAGKDVGSLAGSLGYGSISGCSVRNATVKGGTIVGGLVGDNGGAITNCCSSGIIDGNSVGGLVGINIFGEISSSYSTGAVSGDSPVGGLVGQNGGPGPGEMVSGGVYNCYSTCSVSGTAAVGGLVGLNDWGIVKQCYSSGSVSGNERVGGLAGEGDARVAYCFWDVETSGLTVSAGGVGKTTAEMQSAETFLRWGACGPGWTIDEGRDYPHLAWENMSGEFITAPTFGGGAGTAEDPYLIYTAEQLNTIGLSSCNWDKHFKLMADIDLSAFDGEDGRPVFNVIGSGQWDAFTWRWDAFTGVFDGNDHTVSHLTLVGEDYLGMFGYLERGAQVRNLGIVDVNIVGSGSFVGALAGLSRGDLNRCYSSGAVYGGWSVGGLLGASLGWTNWDPAVTQCHSTCVVSGNDWLGGLVGSNGGVLTQCFSAGEVSGRDSVGGLVGRNGRGTVSKCYSTGSVSGDSDVGGLVGHNDNGSIATSYSTGAVSGDESVGGLVGCNGSPYSSRNRSIITTSYSTGRISGNKSVGGLVGFHYYGSITASFWDMGTSGQITSAVGTGLTTAAMQDINTYLNAGWDFVDEVVNGTCDYWQMSPGDYPQLHYHIGDGPAMPEGLGTAQEPYLIRDVRDLGTVWFKPLAHYRLETSLDLSGIMWSMAVVPWFGGTFDGNGYVISNLQIQGGSYLGLFGELGSEAKVSHLRIEAVDVNGDRYVSGLAGKNWASITNCYSTGTVIGHWYVGGLAGSSENGSITASHSNGTVRGDVRVGGLVGENYRGNITNSDAIGAVNGNVSVGGLAGNNYGGGITASHSTGTVSGDMWVGGLVGYNFSFNYYSRDSITASYSTGVISGNSRVGGLVGHNELGAITASYSAGTVSGDVRVGGLVGWHDRGRIAASYSTGAVGGDARVGGLVGYSWRGNIDASFSAGTVNGNEDVGGLVGHQAHGSATASFWDTETSGQMTSSGGTGRTTAEMKTAITFLEVGWDFADEAENGTEDIWWILEGQDYPRLWWETEDN
ncbi:MAG: GLUG motif-containing protein [Planctomycetota bacterium]